MKQETFKDAPFESKCNISTRSIIVSAKGHLTCDLLRESVILNTNTGEYFGLNKAANRIWALIQMPKTIDEIHQALLEIYEVDSLLCKEELITFCQTLATKSLIEIKNEAAS